jgi:WD40 repeat protein
MMATTSIVFVAGLSTVRGADQPLTSTIRGREVIRFADEPRDVRVYDLAFSPRRDPLVCAFALERAVQVWDVSAKPHRIATVNPPRPRRVAEDYWGDAHGLAFSGDGGLLAMGYFFSVQIWDFDHRRILYTVPASWDPEPVRFSVTDSTLFVGCTWRGMFTVMGPFPSKIEIWRRREYEQLIVKDPKNFESNQGRPRPVRDETEPQEKEDVYCLTISPDGKHFFAGGGPVFPEIDRKHWRESPVAMWDTATASRVFDIHDKEGPILRFCLSPDGRVLFTCGDKVLGWDAGKSGPPIQRFDTSGQRMLSIAVSPDGTMVAAGGPEGTVLVWHADSVTKLVRMTHQGGPVYGLAFSPNSRKLVAAGERGIATVWDIEPPSRKR